MAGGEGTRLRPMTANQPKPMLPVVNRPIMEHVLRLLRKHELTETVVTVQFLASIVRNYFGDGEDFGMSLQYATEETPLGTAGSVKNAEDALRDEPFRPVRDVRSAEPGLRQQGHPVREIRPRIASEHEHEIAGDLVECCANAAPELRDHVSRDPAYRNLA